MHSGRTEDAHFAQRQDRGCTGAGQRIYRGRVENAQGIHADTDVYGVRYICAEDAYGDKKISCVQAKMKLLSIKNWPQSALYPEKFATCVQAC